MNSPYFISPKYNKTYENYCDNKKSPTHHYQKVFQFPAKYHPHENNERPFSKNSNSDSSKNLLRKTYSDVSITPRGSGKQNHYQNVSNRLENETKDQKDKSILKNIVNEKDILSVSSNTTGSIKKTIISKALYGLDLKNATTDQINHNNQQRLKNYTQFIPKDGELPNSQPIKFSNKQVGRIIAYAAATNMGLIRKYNEDRVSIILNMVKQGKEDIQPSFFFGVFDGHGGCACSDFLRDNLHQFVVKQPMYPEDPQQSLRRGFIEAEKTFLNYSQKSVNIERSGSCAIVTIVVGDKCYVANVGDSRAVLCADNGKKLYSLTRDHKPIDLGEQKRIKEAGGKIFQTIVHYENIQTDNKEIVGGPLRVFPGRLSVSRTFGDIEAKLPCYGGNPQVIIAHPQITMFKLSEEHDFIVMGSDGIFDKMSNEDVIECCFRQKNEVEDEHMFSKRAVQNVLKQSMNRKSMDNVTLVMIGMQNQKGFKKFSKEKGFFRQRKVKVTFGKEGKEQRISSADKRLPR